MKLKCKINIQTQDKQHKKHQTKGEAYHLKLLSKGVQNDLVFLGKYYY